MKLNNLSPHKLKKLNSGELKELCADIRRFLIESISKTGGHLASNLGVVELSVALHYCFNSPTDKLIWDVGHQAYVHKIITGRADRFNTLRKLDGLSGFPKSSESEHDVFNTGHSSTSISAALGFCVARDLKNERSKVVAVIGDGSMTGGLAFEGLNNAGRKNTDIIVILNDNQMSISENVGALSVYLNEFRTAKKYLEAKADIIKFLHKLPLIEKPLTNVLDKAKSSIRNMLVPGHLFEELGFTYIGPLDGHNIKQLIRVLTKVRAMKGPILVHVYTTKGKGYEMAEINPSGFHGVPAFDIDTGESNVRDTITYSHVFGQTLCELAAKDKRILAVTASMTDGTGLTCFKERFPNRIFDVGIAEAHAVTFCAGLAKSGFLPVFAVYSSFLQRSYDQLMSDICLQNLHAVFAIDRSGLVGSDGETHQGIYDISFLSHMPNLMIFSPKCAEEMKLLLTHIFTLSCPVAIRYPRGEAIQLPTQDISNHYYEIHRSSLVDNVVARIAMVSVGTIFKEVYESAKLLEAKGVAVDIINPRILKPIENELCNILSKYERVLTVEENVRTGGFGSSLLLALNENNIVSKLQILSLPDDFIPQGTRAELLKRYGLDAQGLFNEIIRLLSLVVCEIQGV